MRSDRHRTYVAVTAVAVSIVLALAAVFVAFYVLRSVTNERAQRSIQINNYLTKQCARDKKKDAVFIGILQRSIDGAERSETAKPERVNAYVMKTRRDIEAIRDVDRQCVADIPAPIPSH